ncbi:MAG: aspartate kinase [Bacteroidales bacterium]|nr:aspartate kinase [Bacteroidales bacterium]
MMKVLKFGGSSVADATRMSQVLDIVHEALRGDNRVILVSSAIKGCTDALISMEEERYDPNLPYHRDRIHERHKAIVQRLFTGTERAEMLKELDELFKKLFSAPSEQYRNFGELFSTRILARKFACEGVKVKWLDSRELIKVSGRKSLLKDVTYNNIRSAVEACPDIQLFVVPGFVASYKNGPSTNLGRGGSDYSAAIYAAALHADVMEIWTDVPGMMTANPSVVPQAVTIPVLSYEAALELASRGAKVLYAPTVGPVMEEGIEFSIRNTFDPGQPGTIVRGHSQKEGGSWKGVTSTSDPNTEESVIALVGEGRPASARQRIISALSDAGISHIGEIRESAGLCLVTVLHVIERQALAAIHREFFEPGANTVIPVFIAGYGAVGRELVRLIGESSERISRRRGKDIVIMGLANSRKQIIDMKGILPSAAASRLSRSKEDSANFIFTVAKTAPKGSVFVDCTGSTLLNDAYYALFEHGINVVTSNRRSLAVPFVNYTALKQDARRHGVFFRYDTTVGNSLPVLESIASDANCSDSVESIEAVVSCTLNFILTTHESCGGLVPMAKLLQKAQAEGLTERDPRTDLGGEDVLRKLLILAREAGVPLEKEDVKISPMIVKSFFTCPIEKFYDKMMKAERDFVLREKKLSAEGLRERFTAILRRDPKAAKGYRAEIKMVSYGPESPFYWISGTENVIVVHSENSSPLVVKGAGEGAREAAIGIIKDILS